MPSFLFFAFAALLLAGQPAQAAAPGAFRPIAHGCPHCMMAGSNLSNQCLQKSDFEGADLDKAKLVLTCLSGANLKDAKLRGADLSGANLARTNLDGTDFTGAVLSSTSFKGTDLRHAKGLTQAQLDKACGDATTKAPAGMTVPVCTY